MAPRHGHVRIAKVVVIRLASVWLASVWCRLSGSSRRRAIIDSDELAVASAACLRVSDVRWLCPCPRDAAVALDEDRPRELLLAVLPLGVRTGKANRDGRLWRRRWRRGAGLLLRRRGSALLGRRELGRREHHRRAAAIVAAKIAVRVSDELRVCDNVLVRVQAQTERGDVFVVGL